MHGENASCGVDGVIITGDLDRRPSRTPDYEAESLALTALAKTMSIKPAAVLQHLVEAAMDLTRASSAGISLLEHGGEQDTFRWVATTGAWAPYRDGTMPRGESPCGEVIAREAVLLLAHPERAFPALLQAQPAIGEGLLAPFAIDGAPAGTVWVIKHRSEDLFEAEDARLLTSLAQFASAAHQMVLALGDAEARRLTSETRLRALARASSDVFYIMSADMSELRELSGGDFLTDTTGPSRAWLQDYIPPEDRARTVAAVSEAVRTKTVFELEHRVHQADGSAGWAVSRAVPILNTDGNVVEWFGAASDITTRKRAEDALRGSEERQTFLLKLSDALRAQPNDDAVVDIATRMLAKEMGLDRCYAAAIYTSEDRVDIVREFRRADLAPMPSQLRYSDYPEAAKQSFVRTLVFHDSANEPALTDTDKRSLAAMSFGALISPPLRHGAGKPVWAMGAVMSQPRCWTSGEVALVEDVAERTWAAVARARVEAALRESEARLTAAFESVPLGAAVVDLSGSAVVANADYRRFLPTGVIPSRDPERGSRWRGWDEQGKPLDPADFPGARAIRGERVVPGQEMLFTDDDRREIWTSVATVPIRDEDGRVTGQICTISDIDALKRANDALLDSEARFRQFSDASTNVLWIRDAETLRMMFASAAFDTIYGIPGPDRGGDGKLRAWARLIEPRRRKAVLENFRRVRAGERIEQEFRIRRASDGALRWVHNTDFPLRDAAGAVRWIAGLGADITDAKEATDRQGVLVAELQHRTRNLIAVVRSLSDRTLGNASSLDDFGKRFRLRLSALSRVQGLLSHLTIGERVAFDELLRSELTAHGATDGLAGKVTLDGPAGVPLRSGTVQTLALALHELATNAVKYGALAAPDGHLAVRWHVEPGVGNDAPHLHVEWQESGVDLPQSSAPSRGGGYGRELIERALPYQLKARTSYEFGADGVRCTIAVPISGLGMSDGVSSRE